MQMHRQDPDQLLEAIWQEEKEAQRGHLKIFFGYAAGVGKTYTMLKAAHAAKRRNVDVVAGYIEPHERPQTAALLHGLEELPNLTIRHGGMTLREFDLDAAIKRKPQLILVDELAHTNGNGCRHTKRYQDVKELLRAGIDVYTTVNVQHMESLNDMVASITGISVQERIPDSIFDQANQVELVDIEPQELIERLNGGRVYEKKQAEKAVENFFTIDNLTALREIALRRCADRMNMLTENTRLKSHKEFFTDEHVLVCLSSAPSNPKIIRTAARMATAFKGELTALFVETPDFATMREEDKKRLRANMRLAQQLDAKIETVYGDDIAYQISEFARLSGVSKIVIGRSSATRRHIFSMPTLTERLILNAPNLDIYIIPDSRVEAKYKPAKGKKTEVFQVSFVDVFKSFAVLVMATLIGLLFSELHFSEANIITVYILGVLITSVTTKHRVYSLVSSIISVLVFNFLFTAPRFSFAAYDKGYPITFVVMFLAALITGTLAEKLKNHVRQAVQAAYRTKVLLDTNQLLHQAKGKDEIILNTANQVTRLLDRGAIFYCAEDGALSRPFIFSPTEETVDACCVSDNEKAVASWVLKNNKHAGATTDTLSSAKCLYLAVRVNNNVYGVVGIVMGQQPLGAFENSVLLSILGECALALENEKNAREKEQAAIQAKNEQLRANLLRAISHDLRTPLTSISGNASNLLSNGKIFDDVKKTQIYSDIYDDSMWLINLVENLLSITRIEDGHMNIRPSTEIMDEVVAEALRHISRKKVEHEITVNNTEDLILARIDARLVIQVIINIVDNAIKYTPKGSTIEIITKREQDRVVVTIGDNGMGITDEVKEHVFDMFYSGANKIVDSRRSLGLGLALCKSIINAHGGEIFVKDNEPHGTIFTFTLPEGTVDLHE